MPHELIATRVRVMTWNVWWRYGPWQERRRPIRETIARSEPDIVALQEVWGHEGTSFGTEIAAHLGFEHVFDARRIRDGLGFGNAILSRWPLRDVRTLPLPAGDAPDEERLVLHARAMGPRGAIPVFCTHLNWQPDHSRIRQLQVAALASFVAELASGGFSAVVCGDFNAQPISDEVRMLTGDAACPVAGVVFRDAWQQAGDGGAGYTWNNVNPYAAAELEPSSRIDYVFVAPPNKGNGAGHVLACAMIGDEPVGGVWPSDHFGLVADIRY